MQFSESVANILLRHADAMQIDPFCMTYSTVCRLLQWILRIWRTDGIRIPAPNRSTDFDPALPLISAANAAKAGYNPLILLSGAPEGREIWAVWALYKQLTDGKPLKDATRDDGRKVVQHFESQGLRSATIQKKITWPNAAVNLAIKESKLTFSQFSNVVPKRDDKQKRLPLSEADIKNAKRALGQLDESDQLLFRLLAATGNEIERGIRD